MFYNYHRSYDAKTGRYSQPDPIGLDGGWNRFGYVDANPLSFVDPLGLRGSGGALRPSTNMYRQPQLPYMPTQPPRPQPLQPRGTESSAQGYLGRLEGHGNYADGGGALTGAGDLFRHPSVPNAFERLINPQRSEPFVPTVPTIPSGPSCRTICSPDKPGQCSADSGCRTVCGPVAEARR
ncbi:RHS repeat-associated core domain protein [compost metagenome]